MNDDNAPAAVGWTTIKHFQLKSAGRIQVMTDTGDDRIAVTASDSVVYDGLLLLPAEAVRVALTLVAAAFRGWLHR